MLTTAPTPVPLTTRLLHPLRPAHGPGAIAHAVHGLVLFLAIVGATFVGDYPAGRMLVFSVGAVVLFWIAHVYAATLARDHGEDLSMRTELLAMWAEAKRALPVLEACIAPAIPLVLAMVGVIALPLAYGLSLAIGIVTLAAVGFVAVHTRRGSLRRSIAAAAGTGSFGAAIIAAETFWH